jgi:hypothetical protein
MTCSHRHVDPQPPRPTPRFSITLRRSAAMRAVQPALQLVCGVWVVLSGLAACSSGGCPEGTQRFGDRCVTPAAPTPPALTLVSAAPADGAEDFARQDPLVLTFSAALDASTVREDTVVLRDGDALVPADLLVQGAELRVTPRARLSMLAEHVLTVTTQVRGTGGETPAQDIAVRATTQDGAWQAPVYLETDNAGSIYTSTLLVDDAGNAMAVWTQSDGVRDNLWANRYEVGKGWLGPALIEDDDTGGASLPMAVVDAAGNVTAVWSHSDGTRNNIRANFFDAAKGTWGKATLLENSINSANVRRLVVDAQGRATALWIQSNGTNYDLWAKRHVPGLGWIDGQLIDTSEAGNVTGATVTADVQGNLTVAWDQRDGARTDVWARRYEQGVWKDARLLEDDTTNDAVYWDVLPDSAGNVTVLFRVSDASGGQAWARRLEAGADWQDAVQISGPSPWTLGLFSTGDPVIDASGNIAAHWIESNGTSRRVVANRYTVGQGWQQAPSVLSADGVTDLYVGINPVIDRAGRVTVGWRGKQDGVNALFANRYEPGRGWLPAQNIVSDTQSLFWSRWVIDANDNITSLINKAEGDNQSDLWAVRCDAEGRWGSPAALHGSDTLEVGQFAYSGALLPVVGGGGNVTVAWTRTIYDPNTLETVSVRVFSNRYQAARGSWTGVQSLQLPPHDVANAYLETMAGDRHGNIIALMQEWTEGSTTNLVASRFE